jgi:hypothetical protein
MTLNSAALHIEALLVARNPRGMATVRDALEPGYLLRAAEAVLALKRMRRESPHVALLTGFPVDQTIETDGPAGVHALYHALQRAGCSPVIWTDHLLTPALFPGLKTRPRPNADALSAGDNAPDALIVIERPGAASDGHFYNIRGTNISDRCQPVEPLLNQLTCPIIAIGDGGNEVGMGKTGHALKQLPIVPAASTCDELIVADVSNWGGYALAMLIELLAGCDISSHLLDTRSLLEQLVAAGAVDGVTGDPTLTEDNFPAAVGDALLREIRGILHPFIGSSALPTHKRDRHENQQSLDTDALP